MPIKAPILSKILFAAVLFAAPASTWAEGDAEAGKTKAYTCTGCHGIPGYKNTYPTYHVPRLGGQSPIYIVAALNAYRSGERGHRTMSLHAESLGEADVADIAAWLAAAGEQPGGSQGPATAGEVPEKAQACVACHGEDGMGSDPMYPVLAGQHASYLSRALKDYRDGNRRNAIMGGMAAGLTDEDIEALAAYYQGMGGLRDLSKP